MGGNVFSDTENFDHKHIPDILQILNSVLEKTGVSAIPVGSAATPVTGKQSGDLDVIVDLDQIMKFFDVDNAKAGRKMLSEYVHSQGFDTAQSGTNVHVKIPLTDTNVQVDIMTVSNASTVSKFHTHCIPDNSPYKGLHKQLLMSIIAKQKNLLWSAWQGLFERDTNGKKSVFVSDDLDTISQVLIGGSAKDLECVESILAKVSNPRELLELAEQDRNWK